jgi:hypothetical protein
MGEKNITVGIVELLLALSGTAALAVLSWMALTLVDMKTDVAVTSVKVEENHKMLTTLWQTVLTKEAVYTDVYTQEAKR